MVPFHELHLSRQTQYFEDVVVVRVWETLNLAKYKSFDVESKTWGALE